MGMSVIKGMEPSALSADVRCPYCGGLVAQACRAVRCPCVFRPLSQLRSRSSTCPRCTAHSLFRRAQRLEKPRPCGMARAATRASCGPGAWRFCHAGGAAGEHASRAPIRIDMLLHVCTRPPCACLLCVNSLPQGVRLHDGTCVQCGGQHQGCATWHVRHAFPCLHYCQSAAALCVC